MSAATASDRKTFAGRVELKGTDGTIEAVFATLNVIDHDGDVTLPGAFKAGAEVVIGSWGHKTQEPPIGAGTIVVDAREARVRGRLFIETTHGRDAYSTLKGLGALAEWSYVFAVREHEYGVHLGRRVRFLKALDVFSVDPVLAGAGINTRTVTLKRDWRSDLAAEKARFDATLAEIRRPALEVAVRAEMAALKAHFEGLTDPYPAVNESEVPPLVRAAAKSAAAKAAHHFGMPWVPEIRWFRTGLTGRKTRKGFSLLGDKRGVWLHAGLDPEYAYEVAAHEVAHVAGGDEAEATSFGEWMLEEARASGRVC